MEKTYAQVLAKMIEGGREPKEAVGLLYEYLKRTGRGALLSRIARAYERLGEREARKRGLTLTVAKEADLAQAKKESKQFMSAHTGTSEGGDESSFGTSLKTQIDDTLIGGWRLEGNEVLVDASYKKRLIDLYNGVTSA
jgi:F0F1-type ATP synthase delta subunit